MTPPPAVIGSSTIEPIVSGSSRSMIFSYSRAILTP